MHTVRTQATKETRRVASNKTAREQRQQANTHAHTLVTFSMNGPRSKIA